MTNEVYLSHIRASHLHTMDDTAVLMAAMHPDGYSALFTALLAGYTETVGAYLDNIIASDISNDHKVVLMVALGPNSSLALFKCLEQGLSAVVGIYLEKVLASDLPMTDKIDLIIAINVDGTPGLFNTIRQRHTETLKIYFEQVVAYNLLVPLLAAHRDHPVVWKGLKEQMIAYVLDVNIDNAERQHRLTMLAPAIDLHRNPRQAQWMGFFSFSGQSKTKTRETIETALLQWQTDLHLPPSQEAPAP